jgi:hypothetical protein
VVTLIRSEISCSERWGLADVTLPITYLPQKYWGAIYQILKKIANWYYIKRGDRLTHRLTQEAREKWESETGGKKGLMHMYRTPECFVQSERGYYDLYQFHIVIEPFRFMFYMPVETAPWVDEERLLKPRLYTNVTPEHGLLRGKTIKISRKSINTNDEQIGEELKRFLDA